ncbi:MAG: hypothetical protein IJY89_06320 [Clostridia bacterium]|nr:hypothetical protein [Clostridia bacterium]
MDYTTTEAPVDTVVGDLNDDGAVSIADVAAVLDMIAGKADKLTAADVNEDGSISIADVAMILDIIAGK